MAMKKVMIFYSNSNSKALYESLACLSLTSSSSADSPVQIISSGEYDEEEDGGDGDGDEEEDGGDEDVSILGEQNKKYWKWDNIKN